MKDFVHKLKQKPEHVRKQIAIGTTSAVTALVAIAWIGTMAATGAFSISSDATLASNAANGQQPVAAAQQNVQTNFSQLAGAIGAAVGATSSAPAITVVSNTSSSTFDSQQSAPSTNSATVLSF